jgi:hypothetical protein
LLASVCVRRIQDDAPLDVIYYGMVAPAATFEEYCASSGCILGGAIGLDPADEWSRCAVGLDYRLPRASDVASHELAHVLGRRHAPCGDPEGVDPDYPDPEGLTGGWGWDSRSGRLVSPGAYDLMTYCTPRWPSAYTYRGLLEGATAFQRPMPFALTAAHWRVAQVEANGTARWLQSVPLRSQPAGARREVTLLGADGSAMGKSNGYFYPSGSTGEGLLLVRSRDPGVDASAGLVASLRALQ